MRRARMLPEPEPSALPAWSNAPRARNRLTMYTKATGIEQGFCYDPP